ncbi:ATP-binding protein [Actinomadura rupiterrae]|uniref:ATP-binding protein n=1 Tax=Actinomadura rupiterrae TaxID=559627 RepID=UPI0020A2CC3C|nr:ATP-binding protein [Actinomadura rupiterrae]MCP2336957.1 anti-sigma regulatory factor (Ser/Thr protein kinase) [Actinomadura rupiterrae]
MENVKWTGGSASEWLWSPPPMRWRRVYSGHAGQVRSARKFAEELFAGTPCVDVVALAVSELSGNAVRHSRSGEGNGGWFGLELTYGNPVYVAVTDLGGHGVPTVLPEGYGNQNRENGRGLRMLYELAVALGVHGNSDFGHTVWVDLDLRAKLEADTETSALVAS